MKSLFKFLIVLTLISWSNTSFSALHLNIKIGQMINNQLIEINRNISTEYNKEIVIQDESLKDKIVLTLKKFKNVLVNGSKIEPVQIDFKTINSVKKTMSKTMTITSFYKNEASFKMANNEENEDQNNLEVNLEFREIN